MVVAYGAGKKATEYLPELLRFGKVDEIWDRNASTENTLGGIPVVLPHTESVSDDALVIVFIEDKCVRNSVSKQLFEKGIQRIFGYKEALSILSNGTSFAGLSSEYASLGYDTVPVIFEHLLKNSDQVIIKLAEGIEKFLRESLKDKPKTSYRPITMAEDKPYDPFAVYEHLCGYLESDETWKSISFDDRRSILDQLISLAQESMVLKRLRCFLLLENNPEDALPYARQLSHEYPNSLFINECFYETITKCKNKGIVVEEPVPEYDLSERFCWCGMSFAWCGGIKPDGSPVWGPCFRPNQCTAVPEGVFWTGDEWKEFRKSLIDGSFRYCQKTECPNIVAGWLPKKSGVADEAIKWIFDGDTELTPALDEIHLSYDMHCNLRCPSCRTEYCTADNDTVERYDLVYNEYIKDHVRTAKHLCLSGCGEAMLSPHSKKVLQSLSKQEYPDLEVELRTNVTSINPKSWQELGSGREVIRHIAVSIDAAEKELFEKLRYPAKWDVVCENLRFIQSLRNNGELDMLEFHVVVQHDNVDKLLDIVKMAMDYDADAVTFSRIVNWRGMNEDEYDAVNPFWISNPLHETLIREFDRVGQFREGLENGSIPYKKKLYINMHFRPDPNDSYDEIRSGRIRIR